MKTVTIFNSMKSTSSRNAEAQAVNQITRYFKALKTFNIQYSKNQMDLLLKIITSNRGDVFLFTGGYGRLFFIFWLFPIFIIFFKVKIITRYTGDYLNVYKYEYKISRKIRSLIKYNVIHYLIFKFSSAIITAGPRSKYYCKKVFRKKYVFFLPTPFDSRFMKTGKTSKTLTKILFVGGFEREKGFDIFIKLAENLGKNYFFTAIGWEVGSEFNHINTLNKLNIEVVPAMKKEVLVESLCEYDLLIFPSRIMQGFGQVALESIASGLKILVLNHNSIHSDVNWRYRGCSATGVEEFALFINDFDKIPQQYILFIESTQFWNSRFSRILKIMDIIDK